MLILMDLESDLNLMTSERLRERGYKPTADVTDDVRFSMLYTYTERAVMPLKYKIEVSRQLKTNPQYPLLAPVIQEITQRLESGEVVIPYLSKLASVPNRTADNLLNYWGIHHLHLNSIKTVGSDGKVQRADYLLFVRFEDEVAYLIDIRPHRLSNWADLSLLEILDANWPHLHAPLNIAAPKLNIEEIKALRKYNTNHLVEVNGRVLSPRIGMMTNGVSIDVFFRHRQLRDQLKKVETDVRQDYYKFFGLSANWFVHVMLIELNDSEFILKEVHSGLTAQVSRSF